MSRLRAELLDGFPGLVRAGLAIPVFPTTDQGYKLYGPGRLMLPAGTCLCPDPQGTALTFWPADTANTDFTANFAVPLAVPDNPLITKCLKMVNNGTADAPVTANMVVVASTSYNSSLYVYAPTLGGNLTITAENGHTFTVAALTGASAGWTRYSVQSNTVAGEVVLGLKFSFAGGTASTVYVTGCNPVASSVLTPYFDGTYPDCSWSGAANASTSVMAASGLTYNAGTWLVNTAGTIAGRLAPLFAGNDGLWHYLIHSNIRLVDIDKYGAGNLGIDLTATKDSSVIAAPTAIGAVSSFVGRWANGATLDFRLNGTNAAQDAAVTAIDALTSINIGTQETPARPCQAYIGPLAISPSRITDAETAYLDAGLTAGWGGLELFRFFRERNYNALILPLQDSSVGYWV